MADLMGILRNAGFSGSGLQTAYAIAMAESGGDARAHNPNASTGDNSYGLFQINMLGGMGPERRATYGLSTNEDLFDAARNAEVAYQMSKGGTDWSPWSTYKNGAYKQYLGQTGAPAGNGGSPGGSPEAEQPDRPADIVGSGLGQDFAPNTTDFAPGARDFAEPVQSQQEDPEVQWQETSTGSTPRDGDKLAARYATSSTGFRDRLIANALGFLGTAYSWGGGTKSGTSYGVRGPQYSGVGINGLDCSGLLLAAAGLAGYDLPRVAKQQLSTGQRTSLSNLRPGDVIGYGDGYHIALYIGEGRVVDALPGKGVTIRQIGDWERREGWGVRLNLPGD